MKLDVNFRLAEDEKDIRVVEQNLLSNPLNYEGYFDWFERIRGDLWSGYKQVMLGFSEGFWIGHLISQPHKSISKFLEIKNARVREDFFRRYVLSFMFRQAETIAKKEGYLATICDARSDRKDICEFLLKNNYRETARVDLYQEGYEDIVFIKTLGDFKNF